MLLKYDISVVGVQNVRSAFRAIEAEALASNRRVLTQQQGLRRSGPRSPATVARTEEALKLRETAAAERARTREHEKAERDRTRISIAEERKREQAIASLQRQRSAALMREHRLQETAAARARTDLSRNIRGVLGGTAGRLASIGSAGIAMTGLGAGALFATATHSAAKRQAAATELANQLEGGKGVTAASIAARRSAVLSASNVRGFDQTDIMAAMSAFQGQAGEAEATMKVAPRLAKTSLATGSDITGIGEMYSAIYASLRNAKGGAQKSVDELLDQTDKIGTVFAAMGQVGAIELKDFQRIGSDIAATASKYAGTPEEAIKNAAAAAQLARQSGGSKSAEEAATALRSFGASVGSKTNAKTGQIMLNGKAVGESLFTDSSMTQMKSLPEVVAEVMKVTKGNIPLLQQLTGERGADIARAVANPFLEATGGKTDKASLDAGAKAVIDAFEKFGGVAMTAEERELKVSARLSDADKQFEEQMRALSRVAGDQLLPELIKFIPEIAKLTPYVRDAVSAVTSFAQFFHENPLGGLATIIGAAFTVELAKVGMSELISVAVSKAASVALGGAASGASASAGGAAAAGGGIAAGALAAPVALGAIGVGSIAALGIRQGQLKTAQVSESEEIANRAGYALEGAGIYQSAVIESEAGRELSARSRRAMAAGGGTEQLAVSQAFKSAISEKVNANVGGAKEATDLAAAMRELTTAINNAPIAQSSLNIGNAPTVPAVT